MTMLAESVDAVIGVDTHTDTHTACLVDRTGREIATITVEACPDGYADLLAWAVDHAPGPRLMWAVEGTRSHGAGLSRLLLTADQRVVEAGRPERARRRPGGKSDPVDAYRAAREALTVVHHADPRADGDREALRILLVAREHANTTRTAAVNVFKALVLTAPDELRDSLRHKSTPRQTAACAVLRTHASHSTSERILRQTLRALAQQIRLLDKEIRANERQLRQLVRPSYRRCWPNPASARSALRTSSSPGRIAAGADPKRPSPPWPALVRYQHPRAASLATASTASAIAGSTEPSTPSSTGA